MKDNMEKRVKTKKAIHSIALGLGMGLLNGGGLIHIGTMIWAMALAGFTKPLYGAILGGILTAGLASGQLIDKGTNPETTFLISAILGAIIAAAGIQCWSLSEKFIAYVNRNHPKLNSFWVALILYCSVYFLITVMRAALIS